MNRYVSLKFLLILLALVLLFASPVALSGEFESFSPTKNSYKLWLVSWGLQSFPDKQMKFDATLVWLDPPKIAINILEPSGSGKKGTKWQYLMEPLGVGDDFVMRGEVYRITNINTKHVEFFKPYTFYFRCKEEACAPFVNIERRSHVISSSRESLVLSQQTDLPAGPARDGVAWISSKSDKCTLALYFDGLTGGQNARIRSRVDAFYYDNDLSKCNDKVRVGGIDAKVGDILNFGDFGHFKVESIWPATPHHQAWVVLVPVTDAGG